MNLPPHQCPTILPHPINYLPQAGETTPLKPKNGLKRCHGYFIALLAGFGFGLLIFFIFCKFTSTN